MRCTVVLDNVGVIDGEICCTLREVRHGVALRSHYGYDRIVGFDQSTFGIIDESRLHLSPSLGVTITLGGRKLANVEMSNSFLALLEYGLRFFLGSAQGYGSFVFLAKPTL